MSHSRRIRRQMQKQATKAHDVWMATQFAATKDQDLADLEKAKKASHDGLIATLGPKRRSGVSWRIWTGADRLTALDRMASSGPVRKEDAELRTYLANNPNGFLVMASCEAIR